MFYEVMQVCNDLSELSDENSPLDLDDHGGRTFLRVLLHLTMHDYPPLVSGALHLLFRHFSQRQEVLMAFKQVSDRHTYIFSPFCLIFTNVIVIFFSCH